MGIILGTTIGSIKGDTRSLDYSSDKEYAEYKVFIGIHVLFS